MQDEERIEETRAPLVAHLVELKKRLIICVAAFAVATIVSYLFVEHIYAFLVKPLADATHEEGRRMIYTGLTEAFITYLKLAAFSGFIVSFPVFAWQIYSFISPGLYSKEKKIALPYIIIAPVFFMAGALLAYYGIFPMAWKFFLSFEGGGAIPIQLEAKVSEYLSLVVSLILAFGLAFQLPVALALLAQGGVIGAGWLAEKRRYAIVFIFIVAAVITPPDVLSQIALAVPLVLLYELSIFWCRRIERSRNA